MEPWKRQQQISQVCMYAYKVEKFEIILLWTFTHATTKNKSGLSQVQTDIDDFSKIACHIHYKDKEQCSLKNWQKTIVRYIYCTDVCRHLNVHKQALVKAPVVVFF